MLAGLSLRCRALAVQKRPLADARVLRPVCLFSTTRLCSSLFAHALLLFSPSRTHSLSLFSPTLLLRCCFRCFWANIGCCFSRLCYAPALPSAETKESLRKEYLETQVAPDDTIVGMQRAMLRTLGFAPDHGVACLNTFSKDFPDDEKLQMRLQQFMRW